MLALEEQIKATYTQVIITVRLKIITTLYGMVVTRLQTDSPSQISITEIEKQQDLIEQSVYV